MKTKPFHQIGSARIGSSLLASGLSFARLTATEAKLTISVFGGAWFTLDRRTRYEFGRAEVARISRYEKWWNLGIRIFHSKAGYPRFIIFGGWRYDRLKRGLEELGYKVEE